MRKKLDKETPPKAPGELPHELPKHAIERGDSRAGYAAARQWYVKPCEGDRPPSRSRGARRDGDRQPQTDDPRRHGSQAPASPLGASRPPISAACSRE